MTLDGREATVTNGGSAMNSHSISANTAKMSKTSLQANVLAKSAAR